MDDVIRGFAHNAREIAKLVAGISLEQSVGTGGHGINSLNWIVGHIVQSRDRLLIELGAEPIFEAAQFERYGMGSDAIEEVGPDVLDLAELVALLTPQQERLAGALAAMDDAALDAMVEGFNATLRYRILRFLMHDSFHTGQTDVLGRIVEVP